MRTRKELDRDWDRLGRHITIAMNGTGAELDMRKLFNEERAYADRQAMARAIRYCANNVSLNSRVDVLSLALRVESGSVEVP